jgi:hypothetical protein
MSIGKWAIAVFLLLLLSYSLLTVFVIAKQNQATDTIYLNANMSVNKTVELTGAIGDASIGFTMPMIMIAVILLLMAVFLFFRRVH